MPTNRRDSLKPKLFTVLQQGYSLELLRGDLIAGLTVAIVALPLALALGVASGASPDQALVTAIVGGFIISFLGGSRVQIGGPTGAFVVVVFSVINDHGYDGLLLATLMAGIILIAAGYARLGQAIKFIPHSVITGFTAGIAIIIATSQVKDFLGLQIEGEIPADFVPKWMAYLGAADSANLATFAVATLSLAALIIFRKFTSPRIPAFLIVVVLASAAVWFLHLPIDTIGSRFSDIRAGLPMPRLPDFSFEKMQEVTPAAFTIAFLAGIEALLSAVVADRMTGYGHRFNIELIAQGFANIACSFFGGIPATGAIARTATNIKSGGKTPFAGMFHAGFLLLFSIFAAGLMLYIPMAALAAILFMVAWNMSEAKELSKIGKMPHDDRAVLLLTLALTVLVDLTVGIGVGVAVASLLYMSKKSRKSGKV